LAKEVLPTSSQSHWPRHGFCHLAKDGITFRQLKDPEGLGEVLFATSDTCTHVYIKLLNPRLLPSQRYLLPVFLFVSFNCGVVSLLLVHLSKDIETICEAYLQTIPLWFSHPKENLAYFGPSFCSAVRLVFGRNRG